MRNTRNWFLRILGLLVVIVLSDIVSSGFTLKYLRPLSHRRTLNVWTYQRHGSQADVLFLGTSKIKNAVLPSIVDADLSAALGRPVRSYCLGQEGSNCLTNWLVLRDVVETNGPPKIVVLGLSPQSLNAYHGDVPRTLKHYTSISDLIRVIPWIDSPRRMASACAGLFRGVSNLALVGLRPVYRDDLERTEAQIWHKRGARYQPKTSWSHNRVSLLSESDRITRRESAISHGRSRLMNRYTIGGAPEWGFRSICALTAEHSIPLVVVDAPVAEEIEPLLVLPDEAKQFNRYLSEATRQWGFHWVAISREELDISDVDFRNFTHLHPDGARKFSRHIANEVLLPLLRDRNAD